MLRNHASFFATLLLAVSGNAFAFDFTGPKWIGGRTDFYVSLQGLSATGVQWNSAFLDAIDDWNNATSFEFTVVPEFRDPCLDDGLNAVNFTADVCGDAYGGSTLGVTLRRFESQILGPPAIRESDIVINNNETFDIFDGPLVQFGRSFAGLDFRRIALHELGHVIGLDHEESGNEAIMEPAISNLDSIQPDDILGVESLYSAPASMCAIQSLSLGSNSDGLQNGDCTVDELTRGGGDTSFIDIFSFNLAAAATVEFSMQSDTLHSVIVVADTELNYLGVDTGDSNTCDSSLSVELQPGSYFVMANTWDDPISANCTNTGSYELVASLQRQAPFSLGATASALGSPSAAEFSGGITSDGGVTYNNRFSPSDSLDISATVRIDSSHVGQPGFLMVAALVEGQVLLLNEEGTFVNVTADPGNLLRSANKTLQATEEILIAQSLVPETVGVSAISVDFLVGYGLQSNPGEIYFHSEPLNLTVSP